MMHCSHFLALMVLSQESYRPACDGRPATCLSERIRLSSTPLSFRAMSEANTPFNPQGQSESEVQSAESGRQIPTKNLKGAKMTNPASPGRLPLDAHQIFDASTLDDAFEDGSPALPEAAIPTEVPTLTNAAPVVPNNLVSIAAWSQETVQPPESPNLPDLIALIQELNQCNGALMDRVAQLEEALEYSQSALQAEVGRTQDVQTAYNAQDWTAVQEQITTLFNQLEFAHQTNQRQQILVETVTGQLESSQERVAELEREAALLQQRYNEQTQALQKSENTCRDLQARLQRQQRYTLQFKAALEKSLEVPTPQYEVPAIAPEVPVAITEAPFPKVQRIQPWSAQTHTSAKASAWMKVQNLEVPPQEEPIAESNQEPSKPQVEAPERLQTTHLNLPAFGMPLLQVNSADEADSSTSPAAIDRSIEEQVQRLTTDPALKQQLDDAVKPLADMLAEALLADQQPTVAVNPPANRSTEAASSPTSDSDPLASVMADAEDALWQDLARLIDVSTEDVVKASLSGDLAAFESIDFAAIQANPPVSAQVTTPEEPAIPRQNPPAQKRPVAQTEASVTHAPVAHTASTSAKTPDLKLADAAAVAPLIRKMAQAQAGSTGEQADDPSTQGFIPALENSSWPSPVVYPLRPTKKRQSLAMVDLPTFPQG